MVVRVVNPGVGGWGDGGLERVGKTFFILYIVQKVPRI